MIEVQVPKDIAGYETPFIEHFNCKTNCIWLNSIRFYQVLHLLQCSQIFGCSAEIYEFIDLYRNYYCSSNLVFRSQQALWYEA